MPSSFSAPPWSKIVRLSVWLEAGQASTSLIQRKLRLGYGRAARIIDELEEMKIIGPPNGSRPRKVLVSMDQCRQIFEEGDGEIDE